MVLQTILEHTLVKYLSPYVDGLSTDKLKADLWSGNIVLKDLKLKKDIFSLVGVETAELIEGTLGLIELHIPWDLVYSGEISVKLADFDVKVRTRKAEGNIEEVVEKLRKFKQEDLQAQVEAYLEKMKKEEEEALADTPTELSFVAKLTRKIIQNLKVCVSNVNFTVVADGLEIGLALPSLSVLSVSKDCTEEEKRAVAEHDETSKGLYKRLVMEDIAVHLNKQALFEPIGIRIALTHDEKGLDLHIDFITQGGVRLYREQYLVVCKEGHRLAIENNFINDTWVPPEAKLTLPKDHRQLKDEYSALIRKRLLIECGLSEDEELTTCDANRLGLIEDAVDNYHLCQWQAAEAKQVKILAEQVKSMNNPQGNNSWMNLIFGCNAQKMNGSVKPIAAPSADDTKELLADLNDDSKVEPVDLPDAVHVNISGPSLELKLINGDVVPLCVSLGKTNTCVKLQSKVDYKGVKSAEWDVELTLKCLTVQTLTDLPAIKFTAEDKNAFSVSATNKLEETRNVLGVCLDAGDMKAYLEPQMFIPVACFFDVSVLALEELAPPDTEAAQARIGEALAENQEKIDEATAALKERSPDCIELHVAIGAPEILVKNADTSTVHVVLGRLSVDTPQVCTLDELHIGIRFSDTSLEVRTRDQEIFYVLRPVPIALDLDLCNFDDLNVKVDLRIDAILLNLSPEAAFVVFALADTFAGVAQMELAPRKSSALSRISDEAVTIEEVTATIGTDGDEKTVAEGEGAADELPPVEPSAWELQARGAFANALKSKDCEEKQKDMHVSCSIKFPLLSLTLSSSVVPVLHAQISIPLLDVQMHVIGGNQKIDVCLGKNFSLALEFFNPRVGAWEPVVEQWELSVNVSMAEALDLKCSAAAPLLLNVAPTTINTLSWFVPHFVECMTAVVSEALPQPEKRASKTTMVTAKSTFTAEKPRRTSRQLMDSGSSHAKWRVLNLSRRPITCRFSSECTEGVSELVVAPALDGMWTSMDNEVLPTLAESVTFQNAGDTSYSLSLHQRGTTVLNDVYVQMIAPDPSHKLLLISSNYTLHNTLDVPLEIGFDKESPSNLSGLKAARAFVGFGKLVESEEAPSILQPHEFVSLAQPSFFFRPVGSKNWSEKISTFSDSRVFTIAPDSSGGAQFCVRAEWEKKGSGPPYNGHVHRLILRPALNVVSGLPLNVGLTVTQSGQPTVNMTLNTRKPPYQLTQFDPTQEIQLELFCLEHPDKVRQRVGSFVPKSADEKASENKVDMRFSSEQGAACVRVALGYTITLSAAWLIDRSQTTPALTFADCKGSPLPITKTGIVLLPEKKFSAIRGGQAVTVEVPTDSGRIEWKGHQVCMQQHSFTTVGGQNSVLYICPAIVFTNKCETALRIRTADGEQLLPPAEKWIYSGRSESCTFQVAGSSVWSKNVQIQDGVASAGVWSYLIGDAVWTVEVCPERDLMAINFTTEPAYVFRHKGPEGDEVTINGCILAKANETVSIGWEDPMNTSKSAQCQRTGLVNISIGGKKYPVGVHKRTDIPAMPGYSLVVVPETNSTAIVLQETKDSAAAKSMDMNVSVSLSRIGVSIVSEAHTEELLYVQADMLRANFRADEATDSQVIDVILGDMQVDFQLAERVAMFQRDLKNLKRPPKAIKADKRAVIFGGYGNSEFLVCSMVREATASRDMVIPTLDLQISPLEVAADDDLIAGVQRFLEDALPQVHDTSCIGDENVLKSIKVPFLEDFACPPVPTVLKIDELKLGKIDISPKVSLKMKNMHFLPDVFTVLLRVVAGGGSFRLEGGALKLNEKKFTFRGPAPELGFVLFNAYWPSIVKSGLGLIGSSSATNVVTAPVRLVQNVGDFAVGTAGTVVGEGTSVLDNLTFDKDYIEEQKKRRKNKNINGVSSGLCEGAKSVGGAGVALFSVFIDPVRGAKKEGAKGFVKGIGRGLIGTVIKPVGKLGQAVEDVATGLAHDVGTDGKFGCKKSNLLCRKRQPRFLFGELGSVRNWSPLEARSWMHLSTMCRGAQCVIPLGKTDEDAAFQVLLLFATNMRLAKIPLPKEEEEKKKSGNALVQAGGNIGNRLGTPLKELKATGGAVAGGCKGVFKEEEIQIPQYILDSILWTVEYEKLKAATETESPEELVFTTTDGARHSCPSSAINVEARKAILSMSLAGKMNWKSLHSILHDTTEHPVAKMDDIDEDNVAREFLVVEVHEMRRYNLKKWKAPFLLGDGKKKSVWMDECDMQPHPKLDTTLSKVDISTAKVPPLDMGTLWTPVSDWQLVRNDEVDINGWSYAANWGSSGWSKKKKIVDVVRKRTWQRTYQ